MPAILRSDHKTDRSFDMDVCIPIYRTDPSEVIAQLGHQRGAAQAALRIYDDGSRDPALTAAIERALSAYPGRSTFLQAHRNRGRSAARNTLLGSATSKWLLLLDGDMRIGGRDFLDTYRAAARKARGPSCIVGGFRIDRRLVTRETRLHALQAMMSECLSAERRASDPGRYVFSSNIFLHRDILARVPFDEAFRGWGWEDVEWGLRVAERYPIMHIENRAVHLGLDSTPCIIEKYRESVQNFIRLTERHPEAVARMPIYRRACQLSHLPGLWLIRAVALDIAQSRLLPGPARLVALKLYRAALYGNALAHVDA